MKRGIHPLSEAVAYFGHGGFTRKGGASAIAQDDFNRADGAMGAAWTAGADTAPTISGNKILGVAAVNRSALRTAEAYGNDHYSEITVTASALASGDWVAPAVRMQASGNTCYLVLYFNSNVSAFNSYVLQVYKRVAGTFTELDNAVPAGQHVGYTLPGALNAGDRVRLNAAGNQLCVYVNGKRVIKMTDASIPTGGVPGIVTFGASTADAWSGSNSSAEPAPFGLQNLTSSPPNSANNGAGHHCQILNPNSPNLAYPHNFLYVLSAEADGAVNYGDFFDTVAGLQIHNDYNLTLIQPGFTAAGGVGFGPWYIDPQDPVTNPTYKNETYMCNDLRPWVVSNLATSGTEKHWLLGFSKGGWGAMQLILRHPTLFDKAAAWDIPYLSNGTTLLTQGMDAVYGSAAYLDANYAMSSAYLSARKAPFQASTRLWLGQFGVFQADMTALHADMNTNTMLHSVQTSQQRQHKSDSGWIQDAVAAMAAMP